MSKTPQEQARTYILIVTVENRLVAPAVLADARERMNNTQAELLALLALVYGDILDMAHAAKSAQELALDEDSADGDDAVRRLVDDDNAVVRPRCRTQRLELRAPPFLTGVGNDGENRKDGEVAPAIVRRGKGAYLRATVCSEKS